MTKPDFIIIGAMKSATSTLHEQLAQQTGIFMSTLKEPNYFSDDNIYSLGESWYDQIFKDAMPEDICGESSTHYTKLPDYPLTLTRMGKRLKNPKLIYVMRHPIDRLISHYIHQWTQNVFKCDINKAIDQYEELTAYSCYVKQLAPYFEQYGHENVLPVFTESLKVNPQKELERVADFIGYKQPVFWRNEILEQNVSNQRIRTFKGYGWLIESRLMTLFRQNIIPKSLRNKVKKGLMMTKRPEINQAQNVKLLALFDKDLAELGAMLGVELSCANFKDVVREKELNWSGVYWNKR
tara:strand:- start:5346 stop:6230 length:885 start_codon:yes stop_codon:yes gene_type:complete